jgi:hypothetical protein
VPVGVRAAKGRPPSVTRRGIGAGGAQPLHGPGVRSESAGAVDQGLGAAPEAVVDQQHPDAAVACHRCPCAEAILAAALDPQQEQTAARALIPGDHRIQVGFVSDLERADALAAEARGELGGFDLSDPGPVGLEVHAEQQLGVEWREPARRRRPPGAEVVGDAERTLHAGQGPPGAVRALATDPHDRAAGWSEITAQLNEHRINRCVPCADPTRDRPVFESQPEKVTRERLADHRLRDRHAKHESSRRVGATAAPGNAASAPSIAVVRRSRRLTRAQYRAGARILHRCALSLLLVSRAAVAILGSARSPSPDHEAQAALWPERGGGHGPGILA